MNTNTPPAVNTNTPVRAICAWEAREGQWPSKVVDIVVDGRFYRAGTNCLPAALGGYARHRNLVAKAEALADWGLVPSFPSSPLGEGNLRYSLGGRKVVAEVEL